MAFIRLRDQDPPKVARGARYGIGLLKVTIRAGSRVLGWVLPPLCNRVGAVPKF